MLPPKAIHNCKLIPINDATVPIDNIYWTYGYGCYELLKVRKGLLYFPDDHIDRLFHSAKTIQLPLPYTKEQIKDSLNQLIQSLDNHEPNKSHSQSYNLKILAIKSTDPNIQTDLYIFASNPRFIPKKLYRDGVKAITIKGERVFPQAKTLAMLTSAIAFESAKQQNAYDALFIDRDNQIVEGSRANFYAIKTKDNTTTIYTSPEEHILNGVTRQKLLHCIEQLNNQTITQSPNTPNKQPTLESEALGQNKTQTSSAKQGANAKHRSHQNQQQNTQNQIDQTQNHHFKLKPHIIKQSELNTYDGFFFTGTSINILPISQIDNQTYQITQPLKLLIKHFNDYIKNYEHSKTS